MVVVVVLAFGFCYWRKIIACVRVKITLIVDWWQIKWHFSLSLFSFRVIIIFLLVCSLFFSIYIYIFFVLKLCYFVTHTQKNLRCAEESLKLLIDIQLSIDLRWFLLWEPNRFSMDFERLVLVDFLRGNREKNLIKLYWIMCDCDKTLRLLCCSSCLRSCVTINTNAHQKIFTHRLK